MIASTSLEVVDDRVVDWAMGIRKSGTCGECALVELRLGLWATDWRKELNLS
jgi:hypothetical protein